MDDNFEIVFNFFVVFHFTNNLINMSVSSSLSVCLCQFYFFS